MEPIVSSETSAIRTQTPGNYPKRNNLHLEHGESLRTRLLTVVSLLCIVLLSCVYHCYVMCIVLLCVCIAVLRTLVDRLLARSQYPEGPATGHLDTGFLLVFLCL